MNKERPILMSAPMVRAILDGHKTQTRRIVMPSRHQRTYVRQTWGERVPTPIEWNEMAHDAAKILSHQAISACPYGPPGDHLWVREGGWQTKIPSQRELGEGADTRPKYAYDADRINQSEAEQFKVWGWKRRPSISMPRWASRLTLEITGIRAERLQEITEEDALAEGVTVQTGHLWRPLGSKEPMRQYTARQAFDALWDSINEKRGYGWSTNPWVWVIEFKSVGRKTESRTP